MCTSKSPSQCNRQLPHHLHRWPVPCWPQPRPPQNQRQRWKIPLSAECSRRKTFCTMPSMVSQRLRRPIRSNKYQANLLPIHLNQQPIQPNSILMVHSTLPYPTLRHLDNPVSIVIHSNSSRNRLRVDFSGPLVQALQPPLWQQERPPCWCISFLYVTSKRKRLPSLAKSFKKAKKSKKLMKYAAGAGMLGLGGYAVGKGLRRRKGSSSSSSSSSDSD